MIDYLLSSDYDCRQYGLFQSVEAAQARANEVYKHARFNIRRRLWLITRYVDKHLDERIIYFCPDASKNS